MLTNRIFSLQSHTLLRCGAVAALAFSAFACSSGDAPADDDDMMQSTNGNDTTSSGDTQTGNGDTTTNSGETNNGATNGGEDTNNGGNGGSSGMETNTDAEYSGNCLSSLKVYPEDGYVFDFEDPAAGATDDDMTNWNFFDDGTEGATGSFEIVTDAAAGTDQALKVMGSGFTDWGQGTNTPIGCVDVSEFTGVSFWAKATTTGSVLFKVEIPEQGNVNDNPNEGDCEPDPDQLVFCYDHPSTSLQLEEEWTHYEIPFSSLKQAGTPDPWTGVVVALQWAFEGAAAGSEHEVWIDEIAFYADTAPEGRVREPVDQ